MEEETENQMDEQLEEETENKMDEQLEEEQTKQMDKPILFSESELSRCCRSCFRSVGLLESVTRDMCIELLNEVLQCQVSYPEHVWLCRSCWHSMKKLVTFRNNVLQANIMISRLLELNQASDSITSDQISELKTKSNNKNLSITKCLNLIIHHTNKSLPQNRKYGVTHKTNKNEKYPEVPVKKEITEYLQINTIREEPTKQLLIEINLKDVKVEKKDVAEGEYTDCECTLSNDYYESLNNLKTENLTDISQPNVVGNSSYIHDHKYTKRTDIVESKPIVRNKMKKVELISTNIAESKPIEGDKMKKVGVMREEPEKKKKENGQEYEQFRMILLTEEEQLKEIADKLKEEIFVNASFKCEHCAKTFVYEQTYQDHMRCHDESYGPFVCYICTIRTCNESQAAVHELSHSQRYQCLVCGERRVRKDGAIEHYNTTHGTPRARVCFCGETFWTKAKYKYHRITKHRVSEKERLKCEHCTKTFASRNTLHTHLVLHSEQPEKARPHKCPLCEARFHTRNLLRLHRSKHDGGGFYCVECDKMFTTDMGLKRHLQVATPHATPEDLKYVCTTCEMRFTNRRSLFEHTHKEHLHTKPYQCDVCHKSFYQKWSLTLHKRKIHEGFKKPRKYICDTCGNGFTTSTCLQNHIRTHTGERPFQCVQCPDTFTQKSTLFTHVKLVHLKMPRNRQTQARNKSEET